MHVCHGCITDSSSRSILPLSLSLSLFPHLLQRPTAHELLRHRFLKMSKKTSYMTELIDRYKRWKLENSEEEEDFTDDGDDMKKLVSQHIRRYHCVQCDLYRMPIIPWNISCILFLQSRRRGNNAANHVTWDFDASTMIRPSKLSDESANSATSTAAAAPNQQTNDQGSLTPTESNHKVPFSEGEGEELPVSPQLGIDETAMVLDGSGCRKSFVEGAQKRDSVVMVGDGMADEIDSPKGNTVDHVNVGRVVLLENY